MKMDRRRFLRGLAALSAWSAQSAWAASSGETSARAVTFAPVLPGYRLAFPQDHGAHPEFRTEWWYVTGWLQVLGVPDAPPFGFQSTFFRVRTGLGEDNPSAFAPRQLLLAHAAIADPKLGRLRHDQRSARVGAKPGFGRANFELGRSAVSIDDWRFEQEGDRYRAEVYGQDFAYSLSLLADGPPMLNGADGFSAKARDSRHASYYYSRPQLEVSGSVTVDGTQQAVTGTAWLDHEWSSELMPAEAQGWDWVGLNLDDGSALMAFRMRGREGAPLWAAASLRQSDGQLKILAAEQVSFVSQRHWRSPRTGIDYPIEWRLQVGDRHFHLAPLIDDQELDSRRSTGAVYWEGAVRVRENDREVGRGYLEMTGYGEKLRIG